MNVRTRIAPSPTGDPHVGTAYIGLFNYIFARHHNGKFILRIEDTDQKRGRPEYETNIFDALHWCGVTWDEGPDIGGEFGPYRQSERLPIYQKYIQILLDKGMAYKCFATKEELSEMREIAAKQNLKSGYDRRYRNLSPDEIKKREEAGEAYVVRLKVPLSGECVFEDTIKGTIRAPWADIDDQVLMKSDGFPTYHFAVVVDDHLMEISHVIRGDEWISSTPKHVLLYQAFGWQMPVFMHLPLLLSLDGKKLSKRKNPTSIFYYRDSGFMSEALTNFLTLMGYSMPDDLEIYSLDKIIADFDESRFGRSGAIFDIKKLEWVNQRYIIDKLTQDELLLKIKEWQFSDHFLKKLMPLCHTRMKTFADFFELCDFLFIGNLNWTSAMLCPKETTPEKSAYILQALLWSLEKRQEWNAQTLEEVSHNIADLFAINHKKIIMPILFSAMMGKQFGPPFFASAVLLGKDRFRVRMRQAIEFLGGISNKKQHELKKRYDANDCSEL